MLLAPNIQGMRKLAGRKGLRREIIGSAVWEGIKGVWVWLGGGAMVGALASQLRGLDDLERGALYGFAACLLLIALYLGISRYLKTPRAPTAALAAIEGRAVPAKSAEETTPPPTPSPPPPPQPKTPIHLGADGIPWLQLTPTELNAHVMSFPLGQRDAVAQEFIGVHVRWEANVSIIGPSSEDTVELQLIEGFKPFFATVELIPGLGQLDDRSLVTVEGRIQWYGVRGAARLQPAKIVGIRPVT